MKKEEKNTIITKNITWIKKYCRDAYMRHLFDPVQTHAVYGLSPLDLPLIKYLLKQLGAKQFRTLKNKGYPILCFNAEKMSC
jgi:hypothetical protein